MSDTSMIFQVSRTVFEARHQINIRGVGGQYHRERGETRLPVESRLADGDRGQGVSQVIHVCACPPMEKADFTLPLV
jgi:hypothetical protein